MSGSGPCWRGETSGSNRVKRGGSINNLPQNMRSAYRNLDRPNFGYFYLGFRLARSE